MWLKIRSGLVVRRDWFGGLAYVIENIRENYYLINDIVANILYAIKYGLSDIDSIIKLLEYLGYEVTRKKIIKITKKLNELGLIIYKDSSDKSGDTLFLELYNNKLKKLNELANTLHNERILTSPYLVTLNPTLQCNLNCIFCYSSTLKYNGKFTQPLMRYKDYALLIKLLSEADVALIDIFGGEPLLHPDISKILSEILDYDFNIVLSTNATYIPEEIIHVLSKKGDKKIHLNISIQSINPKIHDTIVGIRGALERTLNNVLKLKDTGISLGVGTVVTTYNINCLDDLAEWLIRHDINQMVVFYMHKVGKAFVNNLPEISINEFLHIYEKLKNKYEGRGLRIVAEGPFLWYLMRAKIPNDPFAIHHYTGCHLKLKLEILPNGIMTPCILLAKYMHSKESITQVKDINMFRDIWLEFQRKINNIFNNITKCSKCRYLQLCKFTCRGYVYQWYKDLSRRDSRCPVRINR